jgi:hypothetical protein
MSIRLYALVVSLGLGALGCASPHNQSTPVPVRKVVPKISPARIDAAFLATRGKLPSAEEHAQLAALPDAASIAKLLVDSPEIDKRLAPMMLLDPIALPPIWGQSPEQIIKSKEISKDVTVYFLDEPCKLADTVEVHPWWDVASTVHVCKVAYQPERYALEGGATCNSGRIQKGRRFGCGCGPNLAWCLRNGDELRRLKSALRDEVRDTVSYGTTHGWTLEQLFTSHETVRKPLAEFEEQRIRLAERAIEAMPDQHDWPEAGKLAERYEAAPGEHAGLLTTPGVLYALDGFRARMQLIAELLWCVRTRGLNTRAETLLHLGVNTRDGQGWQELAAMPSCNECHARMDYAQQFFTGFPRALDGFAFDPHAMQSGSGPIYLRSINDARGEAPLNPASFVKAAITQPEFGQCMVQRVSDHFFGDAPDPQMTAAIHQAFDRTHQMRPMILAATTAYLEQEDDRLPNVSGAVARVAVLTDDDPTRTVPAALHGALEERCNACHLDGPLALDGPSLPRSMLVRAATQVAMKTMPKGKVQISMGQRREMVHALVGAAFGDDFMRAVEAEKNLQTMLDYAPVQRMDAAVAAAAARAGGKPPEKVPGSVEMFLGQSVIVETPSRLLTQGVVATKLCESRPVEQRQACLEQAFRIDDAVLEPVESAPPSKR